jgi:hypothetical protein
MPFAPETARSPSHRRADRQCASDPDRDRSCPATGLFFPRATCACRARAFRAHGLWSPSLRPLRPLGLVASGSEPSGPATSGPATSGAHAFGARNLWNPRLRGPLLLELAPSRSVASTQLPVSTPSGPATSGTRVFGARYFLSLLSLESTPSGPATSGARAFEVHCLCATSGIHPFVTCNFWCPRLRDLQPLEPASSGPATS